MTHPRRGRKPLYLPDRPLTAKEKYALRKARKAGDVPVMSDLKIYSQRELDQATAQAYQRGYEAGGKG